MEEKYCPVVGPKEEESYLHKQKVLETLKKNREFSYVFDHGKKYNTAGISLFKLKQASEYPGTRFGFCISKKLGTVVLRNKFKRQLKEITRKINAGVSPGYDVVVLLYRKDKISFPELQEKIKLLYKKAGILSSQKYQEEP